MHQLVQYQAFGDHIMSSPPIDHESHLRISIPPLKHRQYCFDKEAVGNHGLHHIPFWSHTRQQPWPPHFYHWRRW
jgi:hypothetical protein